MKKMKQGQRVLTDIQGLGGNTKYEIFELQKHMYDILLIEYSMERENKNDMREQKEWGRSMIKGESKRKGGRGGGLEVKEESMGERQGEQEKRVEGMGKMKYRRGREGGGMREYEGWGGWEVGQREWRKPQERRKGRGKRRSGSNKERREML